jgi:hypothetical protein
MIRLRALISSRVCVGLLWLRGGCRNRSAAVQPGEDYYSGAAASNANHKNLYTIVGLQEYSQGFEIG